MYRAAYVEIRDALVQAGTMQFRSSFCGRAPGLVFGERTSSFRCGCAQAAAIQAGGWLDRTMSKQHVPLWGCQAFPVALRIRGASCPTSSNGGCHGQIGGARAPALAAALLKGAATGAVGIGPRLGCGQSDSNLRPDKRPRNAVLADASRECASRRLLLPLARSKKKSRCSAATTSPPFPPRISGRFGATTPHVD